MRRRTKMYVALGAIVAALAVLLVSGFQSGATYYLEISEAKAKAASLEGQRVRIAGNVAPGTIAWTPQNFSLEFALSNGTDTVPVKYKGVRPDNFADDAPVIAEGKVQADGVFIADKLLMQCPSKYEAKTEAPKAAEGSLLTPLEGGTR